MSDVHEFLEPQSQTPNLMQAIGSEPLDSILENPNPHGERPNSDLTLYLPLVLKKQKPGFTAGLECFDEMDMKTISNKFRELGLPHKVRFSKEHEIAVFYVSRERDLVEDVDPTVEDEVFGRFLGVPEKDNRWFDERKTGSIKESIPITENAEYSPDDIKYARLVSWVCRPTKAGLDRTIKIGKKWFDTAVTLQEHGYHKPMTWINSEFSRREHSWYPD